MDRVSLLKNLPVNISDCTQIYHIFPTKSASYDLKHPSTIRGSTFIWVFMYTLNDSFSRSSVD